MNNQKFTKNELELLSDAILSMQNQINATNTIVCKELSELSTRKLHDLKILNTKICNMMVEEN